MTQKEISEITGIHIQTISAWNRSGDYNYRKALLELLRRTDREKLMVIFKKSRKFAEEKKQTKK